MLKISRAGSDYGRTTRWFVMRCATPWPRVTLGEFARHPVRALRYLYSPAAQM